MARERIHSLYRDLVSHRIDPQRIHQRRDGVGVLLVRCFDVPQSGRRSRPGRHTGRGRAAGCRHALRRATAALVPARR